MRRLLFIVLSLEIGALLIAVPWSAFWDRNYFAREVPVLHAIIANNFARGAVSGLGLVNVYVGVADLLSLICGRRVYRPPTALRATQED